jgi:hypothetical protein
MGRSDVFYCFATTRSFWRWNREMSLEQKKKHNHLKLLLCALPEYAVKPCQIMLIMLS